MPISVRRKHRHLQRKLNNTTHRAAIARHRYTLFVWRVGLRPCVPPLHRAAQTAQHCSTAYRNEHCLRTQWLCSYPSALSPAGVVSPQPTVYDGSATHFRKAKALHSAIIFGILTLTLYPVHNQLLSHKDNNAMSTRIPRFQLLHCSSTLWKGIWLLCMLLAVVSCKTASLYRVDAARAAYKGNYAQAVELSTQAIAADSSFSEAWNNRGVWYTHLGKYEQAIADFTMAIALHPTYTTAYRNRILAWLVLQQPDSAIADYSTLLKLHPYAMNVQRERADLYTQIGKYQQAIDDYDVILAFDASYYWAYGGRAMAYKYLQRYDQAISDCNASINTVIQLMDDIQSTGENQYWKPQWQSSTPEQTKQIARLRMVRYYSRQASLLLTNRAVVYADMDSLDRAIQDYHTAIEWDSTNATAYGNMGWAYYQKNDFAACLRLSELAVRNDGTALFARFNRALSLLRLGKLQQARDAYSETLDYSSFLLHEGTDADSVRVTPLRAANIEQTLQGAMGDLHDMIQHNIQKEEARAILRDFFSDKQQKTP